jgi:15-cis-phytoene synthase
LSGINLPTRPRQPTPFGGIIGTKARSFAFAARFLSPERRRATEVLYAFFRTVDDLVDERPPGADPAAIREELDHWDGWLERPTVRRGTDPLRAALAETLNRYRIPPTYLRVLLVGLRQDLDGQPIATFHDLERYSFRVAGSVGLAMCHVLGATTRRAFEAAAALGIAMQLTNILRDVGDDLDRGRVYLPADELARFDVRPDRLASRSVDRSLRALLRFQIDRTRRYYAAGLDGIEELCPEARYPIALASLLYGRILDKIEAQRYDVFERRAAVSRPEKLLLACRLAVAMRPGRAGGWHLASGRAGRRIPVARLGPAARAELSACRTPNGQARGRAATRSAIASPARLMDGED